MRNVGKYFCFIIIFFLLLTGLALAQAKPSSQSQHISASVGSFYLNISGYVAPNSSVVVVSDNVVLLSSVTDVNGYFNIINIPISKGFSKFCLDVIDFKRLGESYTCINVPYAVSDINISNIFLPPTLGLQRTEITLGQDAVAWGYTMPNAKVVIHGSDGNNYTINADNAGYYQISFKIKSIGKYELFADAAFNNSQSKIPDKKVAINVLSQPQVVFKQFNNITNQAKNILNRSPLGLILFILAALIIIIILIMLKKIKPDWYNYIDEARVQYLINIKKITRKKLHHSWFIGF